MRNYLPIAIVSLSVACASKTPQPDPEPEEELVTRKMEPFMPRPERPAGTRAAPTDEEFDRIEGMLANENGSMEVFGVIALDWASGDRSIYATHIHYPAKDMPEDQFESSIDENAMQMCDEQYQGCLDATDQCDEEAFEQCIRAAYRNPYVYALAHLGAECGVFGVSKFDRAEGGWKMDSRVTLDAMACDFDALADVPAATDLDGDSGPELVYSWFAWTDSQIDDPNPRENVAILDANSLTIQYRISADNLRDDLAARTATVGLEVQDPNNDGMKDLVVSRVDIRGYCPEMGFALGEEFVVSTNEFSEEEPPCEMSVHRSVLEYHGEEDRWGRIAEEANAQKDSP